jgi:hypothetical protein
MTAFGVVCGVSAFSTLFTETMSKKKRSLGGKFNAIGPRKDHAKGLDLDARFHICLTSPRTLSELGTPCRIWLSFGSDLPQKPLHKKPPYLHLQGFQEFARYTLIPGRDPK